MLHEDFGEVQNERIYWSIRAMERNACRIKATLDDARKHRSQVSARQRRNWPPMSLHRKMKLHLHNRLRSAVFAQDAKRQIRFLDQEVHEIVAHLEGQFIPGMNWGNHGEWEIDHVRPCHSFDLTKPEDQAACFAKENLAPLWKHDNRTKGGKFNACR